jgi:hypothetical protein
MKLDHHFLLVQKSENFWSFNFTPGIYSFNALIYGYTCERHDQEDSTAPWNDDALIYQLCHLRLLKRGYRIVTDLRLQGIPKRCTHIIIRNINLVYTSFWDTLYT